MCFSTMVMNEERSTLAYAWQWLLYMWKVGFPNL